MVRALVGIRGSLMMFLLSKHGQQSAVSRYIPEARSKDIVMYDGSKDIELTVAGVDGLKMTVKAGSMTLPPGLGPPENRKPTPQKPLATPLLYP